MEIELEKLLPWSKPKQVDTKHGLKLLRTASPTEDFWCAWKLNKQTLVSNGISVGKKYGTDKWECCWWQNPPKEQMDRMNQNLKDSVATDADIEIPVPPGLELRPFQKAGVAFFRGKNAVLLGDEMGLGKSPQSICAINDDPTINKVLIVVPASLKINWYRECKRWLTRKLFVSISEGKNFNEGDITICNYDILGRFIDSHLNRIQFDMVILDEGHLIKNRKTKRNQAVAAIKARKRVALTGTPMPNRLEEIWPLLNWIDPVAFEKEWQFKFRYCGAEKGPFGIEMIPHKAQPEKLAQKLRSTVMIRRLKKDVLTELPAKTRQVIEFECENQTIAEEITKATKLGESEKMLELRAAVELAKVSDDQEKYANAVERLREGFQADFEEMAAIRMKTALAKIPYTIEHLERCLEEGRKIVLMSHHRECIETFHERFGDIAVKHYGGMSGPDRQVSVDRFQNESNVKLFCGSIKASGVGITLTASDLIVFHEMDWVPGNNNQAEDRLHRIGQKDVILAQYLVFAGSLDATILQTNIEKQAMLDRALDNERHELTMEMNTPVFEVPNKGGVKVTKAEIKREAVNIDPAIAQLVLIGLKELSAKCDGARSIDGMGFSGIDVRIGHDLAKFGKLSPAQAVLGRKILLKYKRQLGLDFIERLG